MRSATIMAFYLLSFVSLRSWSEDLKRFGQYSVSIKRSSDFLYGNLIIRKKGKIVFKEREIGHHYYWGELSEPEHKVDRFSGNDINGNGIPDLVITKFTAGAHCCFSLYIFELGESFRLISQIEGGSNYIKLVDADGDKTPEVELYDGAIDYLFASFAFSPPARVILKYRDGEYKVAGGLMAKPLPGAGKLRRKLNKIRKDFLRRDSPDLPYSFLEFMMDMSYSGHFEVALNLVSELWPPSMPGMQKFKTDFVEALNESPYWSQYEW